MQGRGESGDFRIECRELRLHSGRIGLEGRTLLNARLGCNVTEILAKKAKALSLVGPGLSLK
jgi:hypothetical protein